MCVPEVSGKTKELIYREKNLVTYDVIAMFAQNRKLLEHIVSKLQQKAGKLSLSVNILKLKGMTNIASIHLLGQQVDKVNLIPAGVSEATILKSDRKVSQTFTELFCKN